MIDLLLAWLRDYGYPVVFLAAALENLFPVGFATPGEVIILSAAAASSFASLDPVWVAVLAATGETIGEFASYAIGRFGGHTLVARIGRRFPQVAVQIERAEEYFRRRGAIAIVVGRPAWGIKAVLPVVAGMSGMTFPKTALLVTASSLYYYPTLVALAYGLGLGVGELSGLTKAVGIVLTVVIVVFGALAFAIGRRARSRREQDG
jgi:membrane protein DedA with SNARE-associated domain